jgi:hypothetical protein
VLEDEHAGLTTLLGRLVRDAWVFGLLPETETCAGWNAGQMKALQDKVHAAWEPYASLPGLLPPELRERHGRIYDKAIRQARLQGWNADLDDDDE